MPKYPFRACTDGTFGRGQDPFCREPIGLVALIGVEAVDILVLRFRTPRYFLIHTVRGAS